MILYEAVGIQLDKFNAGEERVPSSLIDKIAEVPILCGEAAALDDARTEEKPFNRARLVNADESLGRFIGLEGFAAHLAPDAEGAQGSEGQGITGCPRTDPLLSQFHCSEG